MKITTADRHALRSVVVKCTLILIEQRHPFRIINGNMAPFLSSFDHFAFFCGVTFIHQQPEDIFDFFTTKSRMIERSLAPVVGRMHIDATMKKDVMTLLKRGENNEEQRAVDVLVSISMLMKENCDICVECDVVSASRRNIVDAAKASNSSVTIVKERHAPLHCNYNIVCDGALLMRGVDSTKAAFTLVGAFDIFRINTRSARNALGCHAEMKGHCGCP